jgi:hypothetical protein
MSMKKLHAIVAILAVAMSFLALAQAYAAGRHHKGAGQRGENMYWGKGHCVDARDKPS